MSGANHRMGEDKADHGDGFPVSQTGLFLKGPGTSGGKPGSGTGDTLPGQARGTRQWPEPGPPPGGRRKNTPTGLRRLSRHRIRGRRQRRGRRCPHSVSERKTDAPELVLNDLVQQRTLWRRADCACAARWRDHPSLRTARVGLLDHFVPGLVPVMSSSDIRSTISPPRASLSDLQRAASDDGTDADDRTIGTCSRR